MTVDCLAPIDVDSGSNTSTEADVEDERIFVVKSTPTSSSPVSTSTGLERSGRDATTEEDLGAGSVNVFVVESKHIDATGDGGTSNIDMKPLLIQSGFQPIVPQPEPDSTVEDATREEISGPSTVSDLPPFQATPSDVGQTDFEDVPRVVQAGGESSKDSTAAHHKDVVELPTSETGDIFQVKGPPSMVEVAGGLRHPPAEEGRLPAAEKASVTEGPRPVVELSSSVVMDFCVSWFDSPWIAYLLVVVGATLLASATETDPAVLVIIVIVASAFCFCFFPPPSNSADDAPTVQSPQ